MSCQRCGRCCVTANIKLPGIKVNDGSGFAEWLAFHRCDVMNQETPDGEGGLALRIPLTCMKLAETADGAFRCTIYDQRPEICRSYVCERARNREETI